jgi:hypothetical protein
MTILSGFADISLWQLALVAGVALFASIVGGVSGYGTGALMPLVLVPLVGAEPVVPIIAISALFTNSSRVTAFIRYADWRRAGIVLVASVPTCVLGAWGYTHLSGAGAALVIGAMLILSVPLRRLLKYHGVKFGDGGLASLPARWSAPVFPLKAADFIKRGVEKGPALGAALAAAEKAWIAAGFPGEETALESIASAAAHPLAETPQK